MFDRISSPKMNIFAYNQTFQQKKFPLFIRNKISKTDKCSLCNFKLVLCRNYAKNLIHFFIFFQFSLPRMKMFFHQSVSSNHWQFCEQIFFSILHCRKLSPLGNKFFNFEQAKKIFYFLIAS